MDEIEENKQRLLKLLLLLFVLVGLVGGVVLVRQVQETRRAAETHPMPQLGYSCRTECKEDYCHLLNMRWNKGDCPIEAPYCCQ